MLEQEAGAGTIALGTAANRSAVKQETCCISGWVTTILLHFRAE